MLDQGIVAVRFGECYSCNEGIRRGERIRTNQASGEWEHVNCPPATPTRGVCNRCFVELDPDGTCSYCDA